jgi:D-alanine--poly(phosphoribitol) ligase subunit 1
MQINVIEYFENGALLKCRDKVAVKEQDREFTFGEIERFAKNCAALILRKTSAFNQPVAVFLPKSAEDHHVADLGVLYSGNCYANLDIKSPPQRLKSILQNLGAGIIITSAPARRRPARAWHSLKTNCYLVEQAMTPEYGL